MFSLAVLFFVYLVHGFVHRVALSVSAQNRFLGEKRYSLD